MINNQELIEQLSHKSDSSSKRRRLQKKSEQPFHVKDIHKVIAGILYMRVPHTHTAHTHMHERTVLLGVSCVCGVAVAAVFSVYEVFEESVSGVCEWCV